MKVYHTQATASFSGKNGQGVFLPSGRDGMSYLRQYTYPRITTNNTLRGAEMANIRTIFSEIEAEYKVQLVLYAQQYAMLINYAHPGAVRAHGCFAVFVKLIHNCSKADPTHIIVSTAQLNEIDSLLPAASSISAAVTAGLLPAVPGYEDWTEPWYIAP